MTFALFADADPYQEFLRYCLIGLTNGSLIALIALGYTMVYGIVELINFAHGDLVMLGAFLALSLVQFFMYFLGVQVLDDPDKHMPAANYICIAALLLIVPLFCSLLNLAVDRVVYKPLRNAPKLAPLVSAIGVSFIFMNVGQFWHGEADLIFPAVLPSKFPRWSFLADNSLGLSVPDVLLFVIVVPLMVVLTIFVKYSRMGMAMRAVAQNPTAAQLMGINVDRVIAVTFLLGGALAGVASVIYCFSIKTIGYQMGLTNGLYAFTAAVLGGIGNIPGAVLGGLCIGLIRSLGGAYLVGETWTSALIFVILIAVLVFRPSGLLGTRTREKV